VIFLFFKMVASAILDIQNVEILGQNVQNVLSCQISRRSVKPLLRYGDFSIFQDGGCRHLGFGVFQNVEILEAGIVKRAKMGRRAKFHGDRSNRC